MFFPVTKLIDKLYGLLCILLEEGVLLGLNSNRIHSDDSYLFNIEILSNILI